MTMHHGQFCWYELMTTDDAAATAFYTHVVGWSARDAGQPAMAYTLLAADGIDVAGLMTLPAEACAAGARPAWMGHVAVDDVDATTERLLAAGGHVHRAPTDIPGIGRYAAVADPQGAAFYLFRGVGEPPAGPAVPGTPGFVGWRELQATDWEAAFAFYADLFGWTKGDAVDMGPMGTYQLFASGGVVIGGMMTKMAAIPAPYWGYYLTVDGIEAGAARVAAGGGTVVNGPHEVPGGSWILNAVDPQGVFFSLTAATR